MGGIARSQHIPGYLLCDNVEIAALCDVNEPALTSAGEAYGVSRLTTDYRELVAYEDIHAVDVCTWPDMHHPVSMAAIAEGKHVFCEKPLARTYPLAREMYVAARDAECKTGVGFTHRQTPAARLAHRLVSSGALAEIYHVMAIYSNGRAGFAQRSLTPQRTRAVTGGGPLFELGAHMVDMVRW